jgi:hypothetical protein
MVEAAATHSYSGKCIFRSIRHATTTGGSRLSSPAQGRHSAGDPELLSMAKLRSPLVAIESPHLAGLIWF